MANYPNVIEDLAAKINKDPVKVYIACTGGGSEVFPMLLSYGGGSNTLIGGVIPYNEEELKRFVGSRFTKAVSLETATLMAKEAFRRAFEDTTDFNACGIGLTASLQRVPTEREDRIHEYYAVLYSSFKIIKLHFVFNKGLVLEESPSEYRRKIEEISCAYKILRLIEDYTCNKLTYLDSSLGEVLLYEESPNYIELQFNEEYKFTRVLDSWQPNLIFPGSFNPPHAGHKEIVDFTHSVTKLYPVDLEISVSNVDKGDLTNDQIKERINKIKDSVNRPSNYVLITKAPTFVKKAELFSGSTFIIGYDTALRILDPKYAGPIEDVLNCFEINKIRFIMFSRVIDGELKKDLSVFPERFLKMVTYVDAPRKYTDLASKNLRIE